MSSKYVGESYRVMESPFQPRPETGMIGGQPSNQVGLLATEALHPHNFPHGENVFVAEPNVPQIQQGLSTSEYIAGGIGLGALAIGIPIVTFLGYKVIRKIGENVFGSEEKKE